MASHLVMTQVTWIICVTTIKFNCNDIYIAMVMRTPGLLVHLDSYNNWMHLSPPLSIDLSPSWVYNITKKGRCIFMSSRVPTTRKPAFNENDGTVLQYQLEYVVEHPSNLSDEFFEILKKSASNYLKFDRYLKQREKES